MKIVDFPDDGVRFIFPPGSDTTCVKKLNLGKWSKWSQKFQVTGFVFRFDLFDCTGGKLQLNAGFYLLVKYGDKHLQSAMNKGPLTLGLYKDNLGKWTEPKKEIRKYKYPNPKVNGWKGYHKVKIENLTDDPVVGWGP
jgi:hypothetical protein